MSGGLLGFASERQRKSAWGDSGVKIATPLAHIQHRATRFATTRSLSSYNWLPTVKNSITLLGRPYIIPLTLPGSAICDKVLVFSLRLSTLALKTFSPNPFFQNLLNRFLFPPRFLGLENPGIFLGMETQATQMPEPRRLSWVIEIPLPHLYAACRRMYN